MKKLILKITDYGKIVMFAAFAVNITGCATVPPASLSKPQEMPGIYHRIEKGQTLWGISRIYAVDLEELIRINKITDVTNIERGQFIFIPNNKNKPESTIFSSENFIWPLKGRVLNSFGQIYNNMINKGINIQPLGEQSVFAARTGRVVFYSDKFTGFGKTIIIDHKDGLLTVYAMASEVFVKVGDEVGRGALIAKAGQAYLHFEIRKRHLPQNPYFFLPN